MKPLFYALAIVAGLPGILPAADYSWSGKNNSNWSAFSSWGLQSGFPNGLDDAAFFNINDANYRIVTLDGNREIGVLGVAYNSVSGRVNIAAGSSILTVGGNASPGAIYVGSRADNLNAGGTLTLESGTLKLIGGAFYVGTRPAVTTDSKQGRLDGTVSIGETATLIVGTEAHRSDWWIARRIASNYNPNGSTGTVAALSSGGTLQAWLGTLAVGLNQSTVTSGAVNDGLTGTLSLASLTSASIDATRMDVGVSENASVTGSVALGGHSLVVRDAVRIGVGKAISGTVEAGVENSDVVSGSLTFTAGANVVFGADAANRASLELGTSEASRGPAASGTVATTRTGSVTATGGNFAGYFSSVRIGTQNALAVANQTYSATGSFDLREANVLRFDVEDDLVIGNGAGVGSHGVLRLPEVAASGAVVHGDLLLGDSKADSSGLLDLSGTTLLVQGDASILLTGRLSVTAGGKSAGLHLSGESEITILAFGAFGGDSDAGYFIEFHERDLDFGGIYAGFTWEGNHLAEVTSLIDAHAITWANFGSQEITAFYDAATDATYIGMIPEPGAAPFVAVAIGLLGICRRYIRKHEA